MMSAVLADRVYQIQTSAKMMMEPMSSGGSRDVDNDFAAAVAWINSNSHILRQIRVKR